VRESWGVNYKRRLIEIRKTWKVGPSKTPARMALTADADFEKEYKMFQKEGIEIKGPRSTPRKGDELWFQLEAELPRVGLDPEKDTIHVSDEELFQMFGEKVPNRGYHYKNAVVEKVTTLSACQHESSSS
jgi:hypothetical protein